MSESPTPRIRSGSVPVALRTPSSPGRTVVVTDGIVVEIAAVTVGTVLTGTLVTGAVLTGTRVTGAVGDESASSGTEPRTRVI